MSNVQNNEDTPPNPADDGNEQGQGLEGGDEDPAEAATAQTAASLNGSGARDDFSGGGEPSGMFQGATAILPEVHVLTGEEKEKKIVQIPARLYAFDVNTHNWKERGRGEVRLNDAAQSEGLFQSRLGEWLVVVVVIVVVVVVVVIQNLRHFRSYQWCTTVKMLSIILAAVMRASGSYRVLLNTHLWAQMKCERANQKSVRITAQHEDQVAVFLITVSHPFECHMMTRSRIGGTVNPVLVCTVEPPNSGHTWDPAFSPL